MNRTTRLALPSSCGGFTLVEALVTAIVLAVGLLGVATMQVKGLQQGKGSLQASLATAFAYSMADQMRANQDGAQADNYELNNTLYNTLTTKATPDTDCTAVHCTAAQLAAFDLQRWVYGYTAADNSFVPGIAKALGPTAQALIECQDTPCKTTSVFRIRVFWDQNRAGVPPLPAYTTNCGSTTSVYDSTSPTALACVVVALQP